jgi:hypothetical protein
MSLSVTPERHFEVWAVEHRDGPDELRCTATTLYDAEGEARLIARSHRRAVGGGAVSVWVQRAGSSEVLWAAGEKARELEAPDAVE